MSYMKDTIVPTVDPSGKVLWDGLADIMGIGPSSVYMSVSPPTKGKVLVARARLNKGTMQAYGPEHARDVVKSRLVKELLEQLINSGVVKITSDISKTGAATFTATVVVNEAA